MRQRRKPSLLLDHCPWAPVTDIMHGKQQRGVFAIAVVVVADERCTRIYLGCSGIISE